MKYLFYAVLQKEGEYYNVHFPDLQGAITFGHGIEEAVEMAHDALGGHLLVMEDDNDNIPRPTDYHTLAKDIKDDEQLQLVKVDTSIVRSREENKKVNKMFTIPKYMVDLDRKSVV